MKTIFDLSISVEATTMFHFFYADMHIAQHRVKLGLADRKQMTDPVRDWFDSRLEPIAFDICNGWLLTRRAQAHFAVSLNHC